MVSFGSVKNLVKMQPLAPNVTSVALDLKREHVVYAKQVDTKMVKELITAKRVRLIHIHLTKVKNRKQNVLHVPTLVQLDY